MGEAGGGYRAAIGWVFLVLDCVLFVGGHVLLYHRRHYYPIRAWNPVLMSGVLWCMLPGALWVPVREIFGGNYFRADVVLWLITLNAIVYGTAIICIMVRLLFICELEKNKIAYALASIKTYKATAIAAGAGGARYLTSPSHTAAGVGIGTTMGAAIASMAMKAVKPSGGSDATIAVAPTAVALPVTPVRSSAAGGGSGSGGATSNGNVASAVAATAVEFAKRSVNARLLAYAGAVIVPNVLCTGIFLAADTSADWKSYHFSYWNLSIIPLLFPIALGQVLAIPNVMKLRAYGEDAWGIGTGLVSAARYTSLLRAGWIVINAALPDVNNQYFDSGYFVHLSMRLIICQFILYPVYQSYYVAQRAPSKPRRPTSKVSDNAIEQHKLAAGAAANNTKAGGGEQKDASPAGAIKRTVTDGGGVAIEISRGGGLAGGRAGGSSTAPGGGAGGAMSQFRVLSSVQMNNPAHAQLLDHPLYLVLTTENYYLKFLAYAESEWASENILFWKAINEYRGPDATIDAACAVYRTFMADDSPLQCNLSSANHRPVLAFLRPYLNGEATGQNLNAGDAGITTAWDGTVTPVTPRSPPLPPTAAGSTGGVELVPLTAAAAAVAERKSPAAATNTVAVSPSPSPQAAAGLTLTVDASPAQPLRPRITPVAGSGAGGVRQSTLSALFDACQLEIFGLMDCDSFARFKVSATGKTLAQLWLNPPPPARAALLAPPTPSHGPTNGGTVTPQPLTARSPSPVAAPTTTAAPAAATVPPPPAPATVSGPTSGSGSV